ncbi:MAG: carboxypeptidase-like regulatory domain-containing protein [Candidatus Woesearchaeota archaeon]
MKKGLIVVMFSLIIASIGITMALEWCTMDLMWTPTECVCTHTPDSPMGFGQVIIGPNTYSCNAINDSICPEDFKDPSTGIVGNCANCIDPDCFGSISGIIRDVNGNPVENVVITSHPISFITGIDLGRSTTTDSNGQYILTGSPTGTYYVSASKDGYDTQMIEITMNVGASIIVNFLLSDDTCHDDCTDSYNRCNSRCDGVTFNDTNTKCQFYNETVKNLCNGKIKSTEVYIGPVLGFPEMGWFIECCGDALPTINPGETPHQKYYAKVSASSANIKNMIKVQKIAKKDGVPVIIMINYWNNE